MLKTFAALLLTATTYSGVSSSDHQWIIRDDASLLSVDQQKEIAEMTTLAARQQSVHIGVLTIAHLYREPKAEALRFLNEESLGARSLVLLISMDPRKIYLQPGAELAPYFPESTCVEIAKDTIAPFLRSGDYARGIDHGLSSMLHRLAFQAGSPVPERVNTNYILHTDQGYSEPSRIVAEAAPAPEEHDVRGIILTLIACGVLGGGLFALIVWAMNRRLPEVAVVPTGRTRRRLSMLDDPDDDDWDTIPSGISPRPVNVHVHNNDGGNQFLTGMLVGEAMNSGQSTPPNPALRPPPVAPVYSAPIPTPDPVSSGGGGSSWGDSSSNDSGGGGFDFGGGGGSDFGGGDSGGGGGSDF